MEIRCRKISEGKVDGEVIVSKDSVCFYLVEPETGVVVEKNHDIEGKSIAGKILVMPSGKGSSVVQADGLFKLAKNDKAPKAMIIEHADTVLVTGAIIMEIPMVHKVEAKFYKTVLDGDVVSLDADNGIIRLLAHFA
jgi:predicted aconitase with swiveling domain